MSGGVSATTDLEIRLLGPVGAFRSGSQIELHGARPIATLTLLALRVGQRVSVDELVEGIWDGAAPARARHALHVFVSALRRALGSDVIASSRSSYALAIPPDWVDFVQFGNLVAAAESERGNDAVALLRRALALWRGPPLAAVPLSPVLTAWAGDLEERRYEALERCLELELELGRHAHVVVELAGLVATAPFRERLRVLYMLALYRCGRQVEALAAYRTGRELLVEELGIEPHVELRELERAILRQDPALNQPVVDLSTTGGDDVIAEAVALGESWYTSLRLRDEAAFASLDAHVGLLEQALGQAIRSGDRESGLRIIGTTWFYWMTRARHKEADAWAKALLALASPTSLAVEASGVIGSSELARVCGDYERSASLKDQALAMAKELGNARSVEALLADLAHLWVRLGDLDLADRYARQALDLRQRNPTNRGGIAHALLAIGDVEEHRGNLAEAEQVYTEVLAISESLSLPGEAAYVRARMLGRCIRKTGEFDRAFGVYKRALEDARPVNDKSTIAAAVQGLGWVSFRRGDLPGAVRYYASVSTEEWQSALEPEERFAFVEDVDALRREVPSEVFGASWAVGVGSRPDS